MARQERSARLYDGKEFLVFDQHVPGNHIVGQEIKQLGESQLTCVEKADQLASLSNKALVLLCVFNCIGKASSFNDGLLIFEVLNHITYQHIN